jgi:hypothetical protein
MKLKNSNIGSVSSGTMLASDLIPAFVSELERQKPLRREHRKRLTRIQRWMDRPNYYTANLEGAETEATYDLKWLFEALNEYAPTGFYLGSHPGDGADYGFWLSESFAEDFDGLKVDDLSEVPTGYTGEVLQVSDHGNMTLYAYSRGRGREVWAIV